MACQSCTRDELCIACRFEGREERLSRYAGRRGETLLRRLLLPAVQSKVPQSYSFI